MGKKVKVTLLGKKRNVDLARWIEVTHNDIFILRVGGIVTAAMVGLMSKVIISEKKKTAQAEQNGRDIVKDITRRITSGEVSTEVGNIMMIEYMAEDNINIENGIGNYVDGLVGRAERMKNDNKKYSKE